MNRPTGGIAIRASSIRAGYGSNEVLHSVTFEVSPGEIFAIVGPNGSGKSTLLKALLGSMRLRGGTVELLGDPLGSYDRRALARTVASVAQENTVAFRFTVLEIVLMGRAPHLGAFHFESGQDLRIAYDALGCFDLLEFANRYLEELSGGERKRVFLARALAQSPKIVMLDEPTAFLDLKHVAGIFDRFRSLARERGLAIIATLHDLNVAATYADRVMLLKQGAVVGIGAPAEVLTEENLRRVYETEVYVGRNPISGGLVVLPAGNTARGPATRI